MDLLIKNAKIVDPASQYNGKKKDLLIQNGKIQKISSKISSKVKQIEAKDLAVSPGWLDLKTNFCQPGFEHKEDLKSGIEAAKSGGFTGAAHTPFLNPITSTSSQVEFLINKSKDLNFSLYPLGSLSQNAEGKVISEMYDMHCNGARGFSDFHLNVNSGLMLKALEYTKAFKGLIISSPIDPSIAGKGQVHEGPTSASLGMKGIPVLAETLRIQRDLDLLKYSGGRMHFSGLSSKEGVALIKKAKKDKLNVSADVYVHNLILNEENVKDFDSNKKIYPPARGEADRKALIAGIKNGTIDAICSDHIPVNIEKKDLEYEYAEFGIGAIECVFPLLLSIDLDLELIVKKLSCFPREILNLNPLKIEEGFDANLTFFQPNAAFNLSAEKSKSKSKNNPYLNQEFRGRAFGVYCQQELVVNL
ncbi:MAG: dihydroorotase [Bacteroidota bacterium]